MVTNTKGQMVIGQGVRGYKPRINFHSLINRLYASRYAFAPMQSAVVVGNKQFPDVSFYQLLIDWNQMRRKTDTVIVRAGQNVWEDPQFQRNYSSAKARGMLRGIYYFYDDRVSPKAQGDTLIKALNGDMPEMEIYADWEKSYGGSYGGLSNVVAFMQYLENNLPLKKGTGLYSGYYWFRDHSNPVTNASQYAYLKTHPLWLAWYASNPAVVLIPSPWSSLLLWQCGTPILDYGQETLEIDMNVVNLTDEQFYARYSVQPEPPPPPEPEIGVSMIYVNKVTTTALNGRAAPDTMATVVLSFLQNDILICDAEQIASGASWRHVRSCIRNGASIPLPAGGVWASDGSAGTLQGELASFAVASDVSNLSVHGTWTLDIDGVQYKTPDNVEMVKV